MGNLSGICTADAVNNFTCPKASSFFTASIIWGVIGPQRIFSPGSMYVGLQWFWLLGAIVPVCFWLLRKKWPTSWIRFLNAPLIFGGSGFIPPATPFNYLSWRIAGFIFNKWIYGRYRGWWMRFNYVTSAALDSGLAVCTILIILTLSLTDTSAPSWWGNEICRKTMDYRDAAFLKVVELGQTFGLKVW